MYKHFLIATSLALAACDREMPPEKDLASLEGELNNQVKAASESTRHTLDQLRESLPLDDTRDFAEADRGLIARPDQLVITDADGNSIWSMDDYRFLTDDADYDSTHPSLLRQAKLNMRHCLYEVIEGIYQVRGYDLSNISFVASDSGWIVIDPLTARETAEAALALVNEHLGERPIKAVIYSHSHLDHFGGVRGIVDEQDVIDGTVQIIAPVGFMDHAVAETVYAGNAMLRRAFYQYGLLLPRSPAGHVYQAIGKSVAKGTTGLIAPTIIIDQPLQELEIDGVKMLFQNTPGTEAPAEMNTWFADYQAFWAAENITGTIHNIYTLRGALVRDALKWSKEINKSLYLFGDQAEVMFASHSWPRWGSECIQEVMRSPRDMYAHLNNQALHLANKGVTINQVHNLYQVPESQQKNWTARGYHGSFEHNSRGVINRYLGYWDGNPATLMPLSPEDSAPLYVEMMGGAEAIIAKGRELYAEGKYRLAMEIVNKLVYANPDNDQGRYLLADIFEQLGYQHESPSVRNSYLAAAFELRHGIPKGTIPNSRHPDLIKALTTEMFLDLLAIQLDATEAEGEAFKINFITPDNGEKFVLELSNGALTNIQGYEADDADLTLRINRSDLELVLKEEATFVGLIARGEVETDGNPLVFAKLQGMLEQPLPDFEIMPLKH